MVEVKELEKNQRATGSYLIHPTNIYKLNWDILVTIVLLYSCVSTPV